MRPCLDLAGTEVCFVNRELYRSLKGLPLSMTVASRRPVLPVLQGAKEVWDLADLELILIS